MEHADFASKHFDHATVISSMARIYKKFRYRPEQSVFLMTLCMPMRKAVVEALPFCKKSLGNPPLATITYDDLDALLVEMTASEEVRRSEVAKDETRELTEAMRSVSAPDLDDDQLMQLVSTSSNVVPAEDVSCNQKAIDSFYGFKKYLYKIDPGIGDKTADAYLGALIVGQCRGGLPCDGTDKKTGKATTKYCRKVSVIKRLLKRTLYKRRKLTPRVSDVDFQPGDTLDDSDADIVVADSGGTTTHPFVNFTDTECKEAMEDVTGDLEAILEFSQATNLQLPPKFHQATVLAMNEVMKELMTCITSSQAPGCASAVTEKLLVTAGREAKRLVTDDMVSALLKLENLRSYNQGFAALCASPTAVATQAEACNLQSVNAVPHKPSLLADVIATGITSQRLVDCCLRTWAYLASQCGQMNYMLKKTCGALVPSKYLGDYAAASLSALIGDAPTVKPDGTDNLAPLTTAITNLTGDAWREVIDCCSTPLPIYEEMVANSGEFAGQLAQRQLELQGLSSVALSKECTRLGIGGPRWWCRFAG